MDSGARGGLCYMTPPNPDSHARRVLVRYTVHPDQVERNEALVRAVYDELQQVRPPGLRYATFRLGEGCEFVHLASMDAGSGNPLTELAAFQAFQEGIGARCETPPVVTPLHTVGAYGFFDAD
jgi:hypothetical protein